MERSKGRGVCVVNGVGGSRNKRIRLRVKKE